MMKKTILLSLTLLVSGSANADITLKALTLEEAYEACEISRTSPLFHLQGYLDEIAELTPAQREEMFQYIERLRRVRFSGLVVTKSHFLAIQQPNSQSKPLRDALSKAKGTVDYRFVDLMTELQRVLQGGWKWAIRKIFSPIERSMGSQAIKTVMELEESEFLAGLNLRYQMFQTTQEERIKNPGKVAFTADQRECMPYSEEGIPSEQLSLNWILKNLP